MAGEIPNFAYRVHPAHMPALASGRESARHPVMIAGGGPVGLALSLALARHGVASVVIEADDTVCKGSRAICLSRRSLEILDRLGALEGFVAKGLGWTTGRSFYRESEVLRFDMPHRPDDRFLPMTNIPQYWIEQFLVEEIERHPDLIEIRWATRVTQMAADDAGVRVELTTGDTTYNAGADWLIACDGARSKVRQDLGLRLNGTAYEGRYVIVDVEVDLGWPTERLAWFDPPSNPGRTMLMHRQPDNVWRLDYQLHDDEDAEAMIAPERVLPVVEAHFRMLKIDQPWRLVWSSTYKASALSLDDYVHGRVIFAGDAAHLVPIFGVRGLNSGFEDVFNLAWKLAAVIGGRAAPRLLASYSAERREAWRTNVSHAMKSTEFMAPPSRGFELMRDAVLALAERHAGLRTLINPRQSSMLPYAQSELNLAGPDEHLFAGGLRPGVPVPDFPVASGDGRTFLSQCLEDRFTVLAFPGAGMTARDAETAVQAAASLTDGALALRIVVPDAGDAVAAGAAALVDADNRMRNAFDADPSAVYLVRPDGYVCCRWRRASGSDLAAALIRMLGKPQAPRAAAADARVTS